MTLLSGYDAAWEEEENVKDDTEEEEEVKEVKVKEICFANDEDES